MRIIRSTCIAAFAAVAPTAQATGLVVELLPGHPIHHESAREAGVVMALSITPGDRPFADLQGLCEELRVAAGLAGQNHDVPLEVVFVVPYKGMAIEGYYLPADGSADSEALVRGEEIARESLDAIVGRAGIPSRVLDESDVEHEVSCELDQPAWLLRWEDIRPLAGEQPETVIESARQRFMAIHRSVVEHSKGIALPAGLNGTASSLALSADAARMPDAPEAAH